MALSPQLLEILACPEDKGPLYLIDPTQDGVEHDATVLYNPRLRRTYEVRDDIPIMLIDEATSLDDATADGLDELITRVGIAPTFTSDA